MTHYSGEFPGASPALREEIAFQTGILAMRDIATPGALTYGIDNVPPEMVPTFITERLPDDGFEAYSARATTRESSDGPYAQLTIKRDSIDPDWRVKSRIVSYNIVTDDPVYPASRTVTGHSYTLPPYKQPKTGTPSEVLHDAIERQRIFRMQEVRTWRSFATPAGTWPAEGLVVPEGDQLLDFLAALQQLPYEKNGPQA